MPWINAEKQKSYSVVVIVLVFAIFTTGLAIIAVTNKSREMYNYYYSLQMIYQKIQDEHARLLLQISSDVAGHKVIKQSTNSLNMHMPKINQRLYFE